MKSSFFVNLLMHVNVAFLTHMYTIKMGVGSGLGNSACILAGVAGRRCRCYGDVGVWYGVLGRKFTIIAKVSLLIFSSQWFSYVVQAHVIDAASRRRLKFVSASYRASPNHESKLDR
jgi:hypothetical protein